MAECHRGAEGRAPMGRPRQQSPWTGCAPCSSCAEAQPHVTPGRGLRGDKGVRSPRRGQRLVRGGQRHAVPIARSQQEGGRHLRLSSSELRLHCRGPCVASTPAHQAGRRKDRRAHEAPIEWGGREENVPPQATAQPRGTGGREARQPTTHAPTRAHTRPHVTTRTRPHARTHVRTHAPTRTHTDLRCGPARRPSPPPRGPGRRAPPGAPSWPP